MTPEQFVYWLQGFVEVSDQDNDISIQQWQVIRDHLKEVFHKKTPDYTPLTPPLFTPTFPPYPQIPPLGTQPNLIC